MPVDIQLGAIFRGDQSYRDAWRRGMYNAAKHIEDLAAQLAPYDPASEHPTHLNADGLTEWENADTVTVSFGKGLGDNPRAARQEFGWKTVNGDYIEPQPYLGPAVQQINILAEIAEELARAL